MGRFKSVKNLSLSYFVAHDAFTSDSPSSPAQGSSNRRRKLSWARGDNRSIAIDLDDGFDERLRGLLRQIVPDTAVDDAARVFA